MSAQLSTARVALRRTKSNAAVAPKSRVAVRAAAGKAAPGNGLGDLPTVTLKGTNGGEAEVYLFGGVVTSFKPANLNGADVLYVRPDAKFDKSKPISGGLPHCEYTHARLFRVEVSYESTSRRTMDVWKRVVVRLNDRES